MVGDIEDEEMILVSGGNVPFEGYARRSTLSLLKRKTYFM